jgi:hypothetical protein
LVKKGFRPKLQKLDNEASIALKEFMSDKGIKFQLTPPGMHCRRQEVPDETMGPSVGTSTTHLEFITTVTITPTPLGLRIALWTIQFQQDTISTTWNASHCA